MISRYPKVEIPVTSRTVTTTVPPGTRVVYLPAQPSSLADFAAAFMAAGYSYEEVCEMLEVLRPNGGTNDHN